jgi:hypothetical protein
MITTPDGKILVPLTADANGLQALVYVDATVSDRNGATAMPIESGLTDKWRFSINVRAVLAVNGVVQIDIAGNEIECPVPAGFQSRAVDVARILHDPRVAQCLSLTKAISVDLLSAALVPQNNGGQMDPETVIDPVSP